MRQHVYSYKADKSYEKWNKWIKIELFEITSSESDSVGFYVFDEFVQENFIISMVK